MEPRGDEPEYMDESWVDDLDFAALDCVEIECEQITLSDDEWGSLEKESWNV